MIILTIRTDNPEAEIGLYDNTEQLAYETWPAHRELANSLHQKIDDILKHSKLSLRDLGGILVYKGPGSFTGLRIGLSTANALAYGLGIPIVGSKDSNWIKNGMKLLTVPEGTTWVVPEYGAEPNITKPIK